MWRARLGGLKVASRRSYRLWRAKLLDCSPCDFRRIANASRADLDDFLRDDLTDWIVTITVTPPGEGSQDKAQLHPNDRPPQGQGREVNAPSRLVSWSKVEQRDGARWGKG